MPRRPQFSAPGPGFSGVFARKPAPEGLEPPGKPDCRPNLAPRWPRLPSRPVSPAAAKAPPLPPRGPAAAPTAPPAARAPPLAALPGSTRPPCPAPPAPWVCRVAPVPPAPQATDPPFDPTRAPVHFPALLDESLYPGRGDQISGSDTLETARPSRVNFREIQGWGYLAQNEKISRPFRAAVAISVNYEEVYREYSNELAADPRR